MDSISKTINQEFNNIIKKDTLDIPIYYSKKLKKYHTLVLSGGGIKGIIHIGALKALKDKGHLMHIKKIYGTSIGSLIALMHIVGYTPEEMYIIAKKLDVTELKDFSYIRFPKQYGFDSGKKIEEFIKTYIKKKGFDPNITMKELYNMTKIDIVITATCVNNSSCIYISHKSNPNIPVWMAVRMSTAIPVYFAPVEYKGLYYADGGCSGRNYPIQMCKELDRVIGIYIETEMSPIKNLNSVDKYYIHLFNMFMKELTAISYDGYVKYTVVVKLDGIGLIDFDLSTEKKYELYKKGYTETIKYLNQRT